MITFSEAQEIIIRTAQANVRTDESVSLKHALGRIVAEELRSREEVPSFDNSAMDGFAVASVQTTKASLTTVLRVPVDGLIVAGGAPQNFTAGGSIEIMTGAPMPGLGLDAVVRIEDVEVERTDEGVAVAIRLKKPVREGENVRRSGTDFGRGQKIVEPGTRIEPGHIMAFASLGIAQLKVRALPRVAVLSTGSELMEPDTARLSPGMIRNSTGPFLSSALRLLGIEALDLGIVRDDPALYRRRLEQAAAEGIDVVLSTGAVSMGKHDFVSEVLAEWGARTLFHKVAIRPGKPILFAEAKGRQGPLAIFGLPGNPVSTAVGMRFLVEPYLRALQGLATEIPVTASLFGASTKPKAFRCFYKGRSSLRDGRLGVEVLKGQASYVVSALLDANCWVVLAEGSESVSSGEAVAIFPLHHGFEGGMLR